MFINTVLFFTGITRHPVTILKPTRRPRMLQSTLRRTTPRVTQQPLMPQLTMRLQCTTPPLHRFITTQLRPTPQLRRTPQLTTRLPSKKPIFLFLS